MNQNAGLLGQQAGAAFGGYAQNPQPFNIEQLFQAVKALNDAADTARAAGWTVDLQCEDYASATAQKVQKGNGPT